MAEVVTQIFIKWEFGVLWISQVALPIQEMQGTRVGSRGQDPSRDRRPNSLGIGASRSLWLLSAELVQQGVLGLLPTLLVSSLRVFMAVPV